MRVFGPMLFLAMNYSVFAAQCESRLNVYGPTGSSLTPNIREIRIGGQPYIRLDGPEAKRSGFGVRGNVVLFPESKLGSYVGLKYAVERSEEVLFELPLIDCEQTVTDVYGNRDSGADTSATQVVGSIKGCDCSNAWVRVTPMFGALMGPQWSEAAVKSRDCTFSIHIAGRGMKYIFVFGRNSESIGTFDRNILMGAINRLGVIDLTKACR